MKITKFVHSCLLVEMPEPVNRTALFDPGVMSESALDVDSLKFLDDIVITHIHPDHMSMDLVKKLVTKFPEVRITTTDEGVGKLQQEGITASANAPEGLAFFDSPHEELKPWGTVPQEIGVHYLDLLSHPGDSHSFKETKKVLALPMTGPWGSLVKAINLGIELKPEYIVPIHDWHLRDDAREQLYSGLPDLFKSHDITFLNLKNGEPVVLDI